MPFTNNITINICFGHIRICNQNWNIETMYIVRFHQIYQIYILVLVNHFLIISDTNNMLEDKTVFFDCFIHCLVLVQPRKTHPDMTEKLLTG